MANTDATCWNESSPANNDPINDGATEIRALREAVRAVLENEHQDIDSDSNNTVDDTAGAHLEGSAKAYYETGEPSNRPDGSTPLDSDDAGRMWYDSDDSIFKIYDGSSFNAIGSLVGNSLDVSGSTATINMTDSDEADPAGRYRFLTDGDFLDIDAKSGAGDPGSWTTVAKIDRSNSRLQLNAALDSNSNKITGLAAGTESGDAVRYEQLNAKDEFEYDSNELQIRGGGIKKAKISSPFGDWEDRSSGWSSGDKFDEGSAGFVCGWIEPASEAVSFTLYSDTDADPSTAVYKTNFDATNFGGDGQNFAFCVPIKAGEKWKLTISTGTLTYLKWMPFGVSDPDA
jgi:hypothetical protein